MIPASWARAFGLAFAVAGCCPQSAHPHAETPRERDRAEASASSAPSEVPDPDLRVAELGACTVDSGERIEDCRLGYRTFGKLDAAKSNAVLVPTWFTGTTKSLVKGVPDKLVDTKRFFVVLVDALGNGVSSSPSNSKKQPRLKFPRFTIHDMVESQRRLLREVFGVEKLYAVVGSSMGGMQTFEWAVRHPDEVDRIVPIVGSPQLTTQDLLLWKAEMDLLDDSIAYAKGEYRGRPKIEALQEVHWLALTTPAHRNAETSRATYPEWVKAKSSDTAFDWNDWHRQLEAMIAHDVARSVGGDLAAAARQVKAKALVIVADQDHMVNPEPAKAFARAMGGRATTVSLDSPCGHIASGCDPSVPERVRKFLEE
jgi:homoserine O-acetyltransferase